MLPIIQELAKRVSNLRIVVIGDVMVDENIEGHVTRITPEAPVPLMLKETRRVLPGGTANVAAGIAALGAHCTLIGVVGSDLAAQELAAELARAYPNVQSQFILDSMRPTTVKTRFWGTGFGPKHLLLRVDHEITDACSGKAKDALLETIRSLKKRNGATGFDGVVISDYAKGVVDPDVVKAAESTGIPLIISPKPRMPASPTTYLRHVTFHTLTLNLKEAKLLAQEYGTSSNHVEEIAKALQHQLGANIFITRGKDGIYVLEKNGAVHQDATKASEIYDVTGAGDTVLATYSVCAIPQLPIQHAVHMANLAGGVKVGKVGVATVSIVELMKAAEKNGN